MTYSIANIRHEPMEEDDAIVYFHFTIIFTEPEPLTTNTGYPFSNLLSYLKINHAEFFTYINKVRESLDSWGPEEAETMEAIGDEGIALLYSYLEEYLLTCDWMESFYKKELDWHKQSAAQQTKTIEEAVEITDEWQESAETVFTEQKRYRQFCKLIHKEARRIAIEVYPELLEANAKQMKIFKNIFVSSILKMHDDLSDYMNDLE